MIEKPTYGELEKRIKGLENRNRALGDRYLALVGSSMDAVILTESDNKVFFANQVACDVFQMSKQEIIKADLFSLFDETDSKPPVAMKEMNHTGKYTGELRFKKKDGGIFTGRISAEMFEGIEGIQCCIIIKDVTERKKIENDLLNREKLLEATQKLTKVGGWEWDVNNRSMFWTDEVYEIHGYSLNEIRPGSEKHIKRSLECYDPDDRSVILDAFNKCVEKGISYDYEFPFTKVTGERIWIRTLAEPVWENGRIVKVIGNICDITDHKKAQMDLIESESRFRQFFESVAVYCYIVSPLGIITDVNSAAVRVLGYSREELIGKPLSSIYAEKSKPEAKKLFKEWKKTGRIRNAELTIRTKQGKKSKRNPEC